MKIEVKINELLEEKGKTAYWLAMETGINHGTMSKIRHNQNKAIDLDKLARICKVLECEPGDILKLAEVTLKTKRKVKG
ncbi:MAG TPA: helix-turn-helix transcriptional regulator [Blastocatellia bacterium]|nr:helix-turn-helix transcriptional regulator [Blastocatellia bacterium]